MSEESQTPESGAKAAHASDAAALALGLTYTGNKTEAAKHFARAASLDLTPSEKSELARHP